MVALEGGARRGLLSGWGHASVEQGSSYRTSRSATSGQRLEGRNCGREWEPSRSMPLSPWSTQRTSSGGRGALRGAGYTESRRDGGG